MIRNDSINFNKNTQQFKQSINCHKLLKIMYQLPQTSKITTGQIKQGLQRIKKAQQQVLEQLRRNQNYEMQNNNLRQSAAILSRNNSQLYRIKNQQTQHIYRQLKQQRRKSNEKSQLYGRRIVDLQTSLNSHQMNQLQLRKQINKLNQSNDRIQRQYKILQDQYQRLIHESQRSQNLSRNQQIKLINLSKIETKYQELNILYKQVSAQNQKLKHDKTQILKKYSNLESDTIRIRQQFKQLEDKLNTLHNDSNQNNYNIGNKISPKLIHRLIDQINKSNTMHEDMYQNMRPKTNSDLMREDSYQQSLNIVLQILTRLQNNNPSHTQQLQLGSKPTDITMLQKQIEQRFKQKIKKLQKQLQNAHQQSNQKDRHEDKLKKQIQNISIQIKRLRAQKQQYLEELADKSRDIQVLGRKLKQSQDNLRKQSKLITKQKQQEYSTIIHQLSSQMNKIKQQKNDLDQMIDKVTHHKQGESNKLKIKLQQMLNINQVIKQQNQTIRGKYDCLSVQKQHLQLKIRQAQNKINQITAKLQRQLICHTQVRNKYQILVKDCQEKDEQIQRHIKTTKELHTVIEQSRQNKQKEREEATRKLMDLRKQIQFALAQRQQLQGLRIQYNKLMKDNRFLGQMAWQNNVKISHLWQIKQVQYMNVNRILAEMKPTINKR